MAIGVIFDLRYKITLLNYFFLIYGSDSFVELEKVKQMDENFIFEYQASDNMVHTSSECSALTLDGPFVKKQDWEKGFMKYMMENASTTTEKSKFVSYLEAGAEPHPS